MGYLDVPAQWLVAYGLLALRMSALTLFSPMPGGRSAPLPPKILLALMLTVLLAPFASVEAIAIDLHSPAAVWVLSEAALSEAVFGFAVGGLFRFAIEAFAIAAQALGFQAGYSYVNMVDPTSEVDASILNVVLVLEANLLFFAFDLHLFIVRALAGSLERWPLGSFALRPADSLLALELSGLMFETALRLALPVMAVLLLIDLTLGLLNQVHTRMQLLTLAFPAKIVAATAALYPVLKLSPRLFHSIAEQAAEAATALIGR